MQPLFLKQRTVFMAHVAILLAVSAAVLCLISGLGSRLDWWHFSTGFLQLRWSVYLAIAAIVCAIVAIISIMTSRAKKGTLLAIFSILVAVPVIVVPVQWQQAAAQVPPIHDITTDTVNPPLFSAIASSRGANTNSIEYGGEVIAEQQKQAYPQIKPLIVETKFEDTYAAALATAKDLNWQVVKADKQAKKIEATDTTFWFGFKDDIVVRITVLENGYSRVDVRSVSRVGRSDIGTNARRIRDYLHALQKRV